MLTTTSTDYVDSNNSMGSKAASDVLTPTTTPSPSPDDEDDEVSMTEPHEISATLKKTAKCGKLKKAVEIDVDEESEEVAEQPKKIVLLIPQVASDCIQHVSIDADISFNDVLAVIYETLSCNDIPRKPNLSYKLEFTPAKAATISLSTSDDWQGCLETLANTISMKKKWTGQVLTIPINIHIPADYMHSLCAQKKNGKTAASAKSSSARMPKSCKAQPQLLNLNEDEDDLGTNEDEDGELPECKCKHLAVLKNKLTSCVWCGSNQFCKIDNSGNHVNLTMNQHRAWANALALGSQHCKTCQKIISSLAFISLRMYPLLPIL